MAVDLEVMNANVRSNSYFIAETETACWQCRRDILLIGIFLPAGYESLEEDGEGKEDWVSEPDEAAVYDLAEIAPRPLQLLTRRANSFKVHKDKSGESYWTNHCRYCSAVQGDFYLYQQPEGAFHPVTESAANSVTLSLIGEPFAAECHGRLYGGVMMFDYMLRS